MSHDSTFAEYHKIQSIWKRTDRGVFIPWSWATEEIAFLADSEWSFTEKVDGTNIRIGLTASGDFRIGGRTDRAQIPTSLLDAIHDLGLEEKLREQFDGPVTLYGEGYGAKIQKGGGNYRQDQSFVLFDVRVGRWWLRRSDVVSIGEALGLHVVPEVGSGTIADAINMVCDGMRSTWGDFTAEGVVCRTMVPLFARDGSRVICKVKTCDFQRMKRDGVEW